MLRRGGEYMCHFRGGWEGLGSGDGRTGMQGWLEDGDAVILVGLGKASVCVFFCSEVGGSPRAQRFDLCIVHPPLTCAVELSCPRCRDRGRGVWRACSGGRGMRGHPRLMRDTKSQSRVLSIFICGCWEFGQARGLRRCLHQLTIHMAVFRSGYR